MVETKMSQKQNEFADEVVEHIRERLAEFVRNKWYTVEQMFAKEVWTKFTHGDRRLAGHTVSMLVKKNALPFFYVGKVNGNTKAYQLI